MEVDADMDLNTFLRFDVAALKHILSQRGLAVSGNKGTLAARAFAAFELKLHIQPAAKQREDKEYRELLLVDDGTQLPDPFMLEPSQWLGEKAGMKYWPPIMICSLAGEAALPFFPSLEPAAVSSGSLTPLSLFHFQLHLLGECLP